jgi:hypothetical protein
MKPITLWRTWRIARLRRQLNEAREDCEIWQDTQERHLYVKACTRVAHLTCKLAEMGAPADIFDGEVWQ